MRMLRNIYIRMKNVPKHDLYVMRIASCVRFADETESPIFLLRFNVCRAADLQVFCFRCRVALQEVSLPMALRPAHHVLRTPSAQTGG
jgi:hypothetical protein